MINSVALLCSRVAQPKNLTCLNVFQNPNTVRLFGALWLTVFCNAVFFNSLSPAIYVPAGAVLLLLNWLLVSLLAFGPWYKIILAILFLTSASINYFTSHFGIMVDYTMLQNILETDVNEATDLITARYLAALAVYGLLPSLLIMALPTVKTSLFKRTSQYFISIFILAALFMSLALTQYQALSGYFRMHKEQRYYATPLNALAAIKSHVKLKLKSTNQPFEEIARDVKFVPFSNKPTVFILVLGETVRADHLALNGYARNTTPNLSSLPVFNFSDVSSCGTATAHSVPCMFSWMNHDNYDESIAKNSENILDIIKRSGIEVIWRENDGGCKGMCARVETQRVYERFDCQDGCPDEILATDLSKIINQGKDVFVVLHQQGSHGPAYFRRSQTANKHFMPECQDETFVHCSQQEIINAYDNSIVETDALLSHLITTLNAMESTNTALMYVSDHGESLGENGVYLHGLPYAFAPKAQTHVPMILWLSESYRHNAKFNSNCLNTVATKPTSHDALFGTLLGLLSIEVETEKPLIDLVSECRS
ncbi:membrane protein [Pseudoalteromonas luteoviolacea B = ATCC 29581]|nr:membrane protein [Pseudoalteromonas luteoviolacea B = ATCC 29581]